MKTAIRSAKSGKTRPPTPKGSSSPRRKYKNPPIAEAVCEFHFTLSDEWTLAHSGVFWGKVKHRYSGLPKEQQVFEVDVKAEASTEQSLKAIMRVQFPTPNGQESVAVSQGRLGVHVRRPYTGWEIFREQISQALTWYSETIAVGHVRRIGIRYINIIEPPESDFAIHEYVATARTQVGALDVHLSAFNQRVEFLFQDEPVKALMTIAKVESKKRDAILLDLDLIQEWEGKTLAAKKAMSVVDDLRNRERKVFESLITDRARELFDV